MDLNYCFFCFEEYHNDIKEKYKKEDNKNLKDNVQNKINAIINKKIILECNHHYHLGCFNKYHSYFCSNIEKQNINININKNAECSGTRCYINCPLCTNYVKKYILKNVFSQIKDLNNISKHLNIQLLKTKIQINLFYTQISLKKIYKKINLNDTYKINKLYILYDDLLIIQNNLNSYLYNHVL